MIYSSVDAKRGRGQIVVESVRNEEQGRKITRALVNALSWKIEPRHKGIEIRNSPTFIVKIAHVDSPCPIEKNGPYVCRCKFESENKRLIG